MHYNWLHICFYFRYTRQVAGSHLFLLHSDFDFVLTVRTGPLPIPFAFIPAFTRFVNSLVNMKNLATFAALAAGAHAFVPRGSSCCFHLTASGGVSGTIGQLGDGQNRIGGGLPEAQFCIDSNGGITDSSGRGCIVTDATTQFQCDLGVSPMPGFHINSNGLLSYKGDSDFVACKTGELDGRNIYTTESSDVTECKNVMLSADSCSGCGLSTSTSTSAVVLPPSSTIATSVPASSAPGTSAPPPAETTLTSCPVATAPPPGESGVPSTSETSTISQPGATVTPSTPPTSATTTTSQMATTTSAPSPSHSTTASCPTNLSGQYEFPHLIIPIDSSSPNAAAGTSFNGTVSSSISTIFNFDIPASDAGKTCSLVFLFPLKEDLETSSFSFSGDGKVKFESLESAATQSTTFNNAPAVRQDLGEFTIAPGNSYLISTFSCPAGEAVGYEMTNAGTTSLNYFQDFNPSPIGLYITVC